MHRTLLASVVAVVFSISAIATEPPLLITILGDNDEADIRLPIRVEIANRSGEPISIWDPRTAEGFRSLSFVFTHRDTRKLLHATPILHNDQLETGYRNRAFQRDPYGVTRELGLHCRVKSVTIRPQDVFHFYIYLTEMQRDGRPDARQLSEWEMQVCYRAEADPEGRIWQGESLSKPFTGRLTCSQLDDIRVAIRMSPSLAIESLEKLVDKFPEMNMECQDWLRAAIRANRPEVVRWLVKHNVSPFQVDTVRKIENGYDLGTCAAAEIKHQEVFEVVCDSMPHRRDDLLNTLAIVAEREVSNYFMPRQDYSHLQRMLELIAKGAEPNLFAAIYTNDLPRVKILLAKADVLPKYSKPWREQSPFMWALACGRSEIAKWMIERFDLDLRSQEEFAGQAYALAAQSPETIELLCNEKIGFSFLQNRGWAGSFSWEPTGSAIHFVAAYGTAKSVSILIDRGADIDHIAGQMHSLSVAVMKQNWNTFEAIMEHPKFKSLDANSRKLIFESVSSDLKQYPQQGPVRDPIRRRRALESIGIDAVNPSVARTVANDKNVSDETELQDALSANRIDIMKELFDGGFVPEKSQLIFSPAVASLEAEKLLADRFPKLFDEAKNEMLLVATQTAQYEIVRWLLEKGADITATNKQGRNALELAIHVKHQIVSAEVERLIRKAIAK